MRKPLFLLTAATLALAACSDGEPATAPESEASQEDMAGMDSMEGMTPAQHAELLAVIGMAMQTNGLVTAMQVPVDDAFKE